MCFAFAAETVHEAFKLCNSIAQLRVYGTFPGMADSRLPLGGIALQVGS